MNEHKKQIKANTYFLFERMKIIRNYGFLINHMSNGASEYKITIHQNEQDMQTAQNGKVLFVGTWDEMKAFLAGMVCAIENQ